MTMYTPFKKMLKIVAAIAIPAIVAMGTASAQTQQNNQLALQLGAIQLGYTTNATWYTNAQLLGNALIQGQQALLATTTNNYSLYVGTNSASTNQPVAQSSAFRDQLYQATIAALASPVTNTNRYTSTDTILVVTYNPRTTRLTTNRITSFGLNPALTTPTAVAAIYQARIPNFNPGLISNAVAATYAYTTNSNGVVFPIWGPQPAAASVRTATNALNVATLNTRTGSIQLNNAAAVAGAAITATLKNYASVGTRQWAGINARTGPVTNPATVYLPNYGTKQIGSIVNNVQPDLTGLSDAAAAIAANAINGLGAENTNTTGVSSIYGKSAPNVQLMTQRMIAAANRYQATSVSNLAPHYASGVLGAASLGLITQVAGDQNEGWGGQSSTAITPILNGVVKGAVLALGRTSVNLSAVATGVAQGFAVAYLQSTFQGSKNFVTLSQFLLDNSANNAIFAAFAAAGVGSTTTLAANIKSAISSGITQVFNGFDKVTGVWNINPNVNGSFPISGAYGINLTGANGGNPLINGVGTPVTDTIGL